MKKVRSEVVAMALVNSIAEELGRLCVQRNRDNRELNRLFQRIGVNRAALNVPVLKGRKDNEDGNIIELFDVVSDSDDASGMRNVKRLESLIRRSSHRVSGRQPRTN